MSKRDELVTTVIGRRMPNVPTNNSLLFSRKSSADRHIKTHGINEMLSVIPIYSFHK